MPIERLVLVIFCVLGAIFAAVWASGLLYASTTISPFLGLMVLMFICLAAYIAWRVISNRVKAGA